VSLGEREREREREREHRNVLLFLYNIDRKEWDREKLKKITVATL